MTSVAAIIFDFDGVLLESEYALNSAMAEILSDLGHPTTVDDCLHHYIGLSHPQMLEAIEARIGGPVPADFHARMKQAMLRSLSDGIEAVAGAHDFVESLPPDLPVAIASSSSTRWIRGHLENLGIEKRFGDRLYSGREHVERPKPAPDLYLHAAQQLGVAIGECVVIEDSKVGAAGALASGARVIGFVAGSHCGDGHGDMLRELGVKHIANSFDELRLLLDLA